MPLHMHTPNGTQRESVKQLETTATMFILRTDSAKPAQRTRTMSLTALAVLRQSEKVFLLQVSSEPLGPQMCEHSLHYSPNVR